MKKRLKRALSILLTFAMILGCMSGLPSSVFAAPSPSATARVDESVGLRADVKITGSAGTVNGITPTDTSIRTEGHTLNISGDNTLSIVVTPYTNYSLTKATVVAIATITHVDGTKDAVQDIYTSTAGTFAYTIPSFATYTVADDQSVNVEVVVYADFTYSTPTADYIIDVSNGTVTRTSDNTQLALSTSQNEGFARGSTSGASSKTIIVNSNALPINTSNALPKNTIEIRGETYNTPIAGSGATAGAYQVYVYNSDYAASKRRVNIILNNAKFYAGVSMTSGNYDSALTGRGSTNYSARITQAPTAGGYSRMSTTTKSTYSSLILSDVDAYVTLKGDNIMAQATGSHDSGGTNQAAIAVDASASLIFTEDSTGSLYARGGGCSAAIGTAGGSATTTAHPSGYVEIDGGKVTAESAHSEHKFSGIGNGGHYTSADPGIRGIVVNGGTVNAIGYHYGIGGNGGSSTTDESYGFKTYVVVTGGNLTSEASASSAGAAIGFAYNNKFHEVRIGRPDKGDTDSSVTAVNWGYGAAISGKMTFYSGTTKAYSGQYAAAIGGNGMSNAAVSIFSSFDPGTMMAGTPLTVYGGNVTAKAGAFNQRAWLNSAIRGNNTVTGDNDPIRTSAGAVEVQTRATTSYGSAIGGATGRAGGTENNIFAGNFTVTSSTHGAGIGGGGAYSATYLGGAGGTTWIGTLTNKNTGNAASMSFDVNAKADANNYGAAIGGGGSSAGFAGGNGGDLYIGGGEFTIKSGNYAAGIGGGGSNSGAAGSGGDVAIRGGEFEITSGRFGAGIGGGGSFSGNGGSGGNVNINVKTDTSMIATSANPNSSYMFTIDSGQFGAGIGGGGSHSGNGGNGAANLTITGGNFGITAGGNTASYNTSYSNYSFGAGIGGGGSFELGAGNGPTIADIFGGYFDVYTSGYGSAIGGGGTNEGTAGGCGLVYVTGGTIRAESKTAQDLGTKGLGGGAAATTGTSKVNDGTVIIIGGNVYTTAGTEISGAYAGQHVWTRPNISNKPSETTSNTYTNPNTWDHTLPTITTPDAQNMAIENTTQQGQEVGSIDPIRIGQQVNTVVYSYPNRDASGTILNTANYSDYSNGDMYVTPETGTSNGAVSVWVPAGYILNYDLNGGSTTNNYDVAHSLEYAYGSIAITFGSGSSYPGDGQTKPLIQQGEGITNAIFDGLYSGRTYQGAIYRDLLTHPQATASTTGNSQDVVFAGWSATPDSTIYEEGGSSYPSLLDEVTFQTSDITVYAVWGFDINGNGIADILEGPQMLSYDGNAIVGSTVAGVPSPHAGSYGTIVAIPNSNTTQTPVSGTNLVFVGWSEEQIFDAVSVTNRASTPYSTALNGLYNFGGAKTFIAGGTTYTASGSGGYTITVPTTLYAVWAVDANGNGIPDYLEPTYQITYTNSASDITATMPTDSTSYVTGVSAALDGTLVGTTGLTSSAGTPVFFLYWTTNSAASSTIYGIGASAGGLLPAEATSPQTIGNSNIVLYAVWSYDANGNSLPDAYESAYNLIYTDNSASGSLGIGTGTIQSYPVEEGPYYIGSVVNAFQTPADPTGWHFEGWTAAQSQGGLYTNEAAWNTAFGTYPVLPGTFKDATNPVNFSSSDVTLYAVWSKDANGNGIADWAENAGPTGPHYVRYVSGSNILSGHIAVYSLNIASVPYSSNPDTSSPERVTMDNNGGAGYSDGSTSALDLTTRPTEANGRLVFLGWSPDHNLANHIYGGSSSELQNYMKHLQKIYDIQTGTNYSNLNYTSASHGYDPSSGTTTGGTGYTPESVAGRAYYTRLGASATFDSYIASDFSGYDWNLYNGEGLLNTVVQSPYYVTSDTYSSTQDSAYSSTQGWVVYGVWAVDSNKNGIADMFENTFTLTYDGNGSTTEPVSNVPYAQYNILADQTVTLQKGRTLGTTGDTEMSRYDTTNSVPYIFLGWTADQNYNRGTAVSGDGSVYGVGDYSNLPLIVGAVTFGSMDIIVHALWGEDANKNGKPDVYEGTYRLIYNANGGSGAPTDSAAYMHGDRVTTLASGGGMTPSSSNNLFMYWTTDSTVLSVYQAADRSILPIEITAVEFIGSDITLYAVWGEDSDGNGIPDVNENPYRLTYDPNGGSGAPIDTNAYGYGTTAPLNTSPAGMTHLADSSYIFVGWTLANKTAYSSVYTTDQQSLLPTLVQNVTFSSTNITVNAVWSTDLNGNGTADVYETSVPSCTVTYNANGGSGSHSVAVAVGTLHTVKALSATGITRSNHTFDSWNTAPNGTGTSYSANDTFVLNSNVTLYAQWTQNSGGGTSGGGGGGAESFTLKFDSNEGTSISSVTVSTSTEIDLSKYTPSRDGYTFVGWCDSAALTTVITKVTLNSNKTVYAKWTKGLNNEGITGLITDDHFAYIQGYGDNTVAPNKSMTRAEAAQMFYNLLENKQMASTNTSFHDVGTNAWYHKAVLTLASQGIITGYEDGNFRPNSEITRAEFTAMLSRFGNLASGSITFSDVASKHWAYQYIANAAARGWIDGYPDGTFRTDRSITRSEVIKMTNAILTRLADESFIDSSSKVLSFTDISSTHWAYYEIMEATNAHDYTSSNVNGANEETWTSLE